jgi:hypothetical protein
MKTRPFALLVVCMFCILIARRMVTGKYVHNYLIECDSITNAIRQESLRPEPVPVITPADSCINAIRAKYRKTHGIVTVDE